MHSIEFREWGEDGVIDKAVHDASTFTPSARIVCFLVPGTRAVFAYRPEHARIGSPSGFCYKL
jgi:hypothetical protein